jgi:TonB family protein
MGTIRPKGDILMRTLVMATLVLAPMLVHAQAQSPAQPSGVQAPVFESKLVSPQPVGGAAAPHHADAVSSALVEPKLIKWSNVEVDRNPWISVANFHNRTVVVSMTVSADGVPSDLKIVDSDDPLLNTGVLEAVARYRFSPASLNSRRMSAPVTLKVNVRDEQ